MKKGTKKKIIGKIGKIDYKTLDKEYNEVVKEEVEPITSISPSVVAPLTQEFGNGYLNLLRDKINEIIAHR